MAVEAMAAAPDSGYSWVIVVCCGYIHFALFGLFRSAGVIYVAMLAEFGVSREEASWPFALCAAVFQLTGPVVSVVTHYISERKACLLGSAIATFGIAGCYFAHSVMWINVFYGLVHGLGFGLLTTLVPVTLNQYFVRHRATAIGIAFSGGSVSSLLFPAAMEWLLERYTLRDAFLLLAGVVMNTLVAAALLRPPPWAAKNNRAVSSESGTLIVATVDGKANRDSSETDKTLYQISDISRGDDITTATTFISNEPTDKTTPLEAVKEPLMQPAIKIQIQPARKQQLPIPPPGGVGRSIRDILCTPSFHLLTLSMCAYFLGVHSFFMVAVDFAKDKGIPENQGVYVISVFSLTDLIGRAGLGWVTDRGFVSRRAMVALNLGALGVVFHLLPLAATLATFLVLSAGAGLCVGSSITLFFVLQAECFEMRRLTLVVGLCSFVNGVVSLLRPAIIGLFRDVIGSYDWMFHVLGFNFFIISIIWTIAAWKKRARYSKTVHISDK